jgi:hypothetical protein
MSVIAVRACNSCIGPKVDSDFYESNPKKCKECIKAAVRANRAANVDHYREFDRRRAQDPKRVAARLAYQQTDAFRESHERAVAKWIANNPERRRVHILTSNAIRTGRLVRLPCFCCGTLDVEAHHPDYSRPLDVVWLCTPHHKQLHEEHEARTREASSISEQKTRPSPFFV